MLALLTLGAPALAQEAPLWRLVAQSDIIVVGQPGAMPETIPPDDYVGVAISSPRWIKGGSGSGLTVRWYSAPSAYAPSLEQLSAAVGVPSLVFTVKAQGDLYFAGDTPGALRSADPASIAAVEAEVARQDHVIADWTVDADTPLYPEVRAIIERIAALPPPTREERRAWPTEQQRLFDQLIALGPDAVPAIIMLMDDDRPLPDRAISLKNLSPDAFEGIRHYGPDVVAEGLAAVLNQITGENFGFIYNGATPDERRDSINGWRIYLDHLRATS